ncbi:hypothetical protein [Streptomyces sediminimaris]|uniref:hypothetical protein n=1 Tax=Streptomyces sediminimaris TaxID=3383721 RepID=UPI003999B7B1
MKRKPPPCTWQKPAPHSLTYARLYVNGWWCDRHSPRAQRGLPPLEPGSGWPIHRQPPPDTDQNEAAGLPAPSTDKDTTT